tara:strand:- start:884 stop:1594 length:711 start_codon:yes stop_codon:yes gene_type:complete
MARDPIRFDVKEILGNVDAIEKQLIPRAARLAANRAVFDATVALKKEAGDKFDSVVPYTLRSFRYNKPENIDKKTLRASVFISQDRSKGGNAASDYLAPHIYGGMAFKTRFQRGLQSAETYIGRNSKPILSGDKIMIPVGKMKPNTYKKALSHLRGTKRPKDNRYFYIGEEIQRAAATNGNPIPKKGIYLRKNKKISLVMVERPIPAFSPKFDFFRVVEDTVRESFNRNLLKEIGR